MPPAIGIRSHDSSLHPVATVDAVVEPVGELLTETIIQEAIALAHEAGNVEAITMRSLARRIGLSATALYGYFSSKRAIVLAAEHRAAQQLRARLEAALAVEGGEPIARWIHCYASSDHDDPWLRRLFPECGRAMDPVDRRKAEQAVGLPSLQRAFEAARLEGGLAPGVSPRLGAWLAWSGAHSLLLVLRGAVGHEWNGGEDELLRALSAAVVHGLLPPGPEA